MNVKFAPHFSWHIAMEKKREDGGLVRGQAVALHVNQVVVNINAKPIGCN